MKKEIVCKNCNAPNPFHQLTCLRCNSYLRERIHNIDFWTTLEYLIESPVKAFTRIIYSEQKNFVVFILLFVSIKYFINTIFFYLVNPENQILTSNILGNYIIVLSSLSMTILTFSFLIKISNRFYNNKTRIKDIFSILSYVLLPNIIALIFIFPLELIFFGGYIFSNNPSPFLIKETAAYIMLTLEVIFILWTLFLSVMALITLTKSTAYSIIFGGLFVLVLYFTQYVSSFYLFTS